MALPSNFNSFEHLQDMIRKSHNKLVRDFFNDLGGEDWKPNLSTNRANLRVASTMLDSDTATMTLMRLYYFYDVIGYGRKGLATFYGSRFDTAPPVAGHPQLFFVFSQDESATPPEESPIQHEKSIRLMKYACASGGSLRAITKANMTEIAKEIKSNFISKGQGITFTTGNKSATYKDYDNGFVRGDYLLVNSRSDATQIYQKICQVIDINFDQDKLTVTSSDKKSDTTATAGKVKILDKNVQNRRYRPVAKLKFRYAYLSLGNLVPPIFLLDTTLQKPSLVNFP